jgi:hypothetical protein
MIWTLFRSCLIDVFFERMRAYRFELLQGGAVTFCSGIRPG